MYRTHQRPSRAEAPAPKTQPFDGLDRTALAVAGAFAGLVGIGIGEIVNTLFLAKKRFSVRLSVGTSAAILHLTILSATLVDLLLLHSPLAGLHSGTIAIPWNVAVIIAPTVLVGGQIGAFLNSWLPQEVIFKGMVSLYVLIGLFVREQVLGGWL